MSQKEIENFSDSTYSLAKSLHHITIASIYLEDVKRGCSNTLKNLFNGYILKCQYIINNINDRLSEENRKVLKEELEDSFTIEAIHDKLVYLDDVHRADVENYIDNIIKKIKDDEGRTSN